MSENIVRSNKTKLIHYTLLAIAVFLVVFAIRWQVVEAERFEKIARSRVFSYEIDSKRGTIYASDNSTLAYTEPMFDLYVWMDDLLFLEQRGVQTRSDFLKKVSSVLGVTELELSKRIEEPYQKYGQRWILIEKALTDKKWEEMNALKAENGTSLLGYNFVRGSKRVYPEGRLASHILGLTNYELGRVFGVGGIEGYWDGVLNPIKGFVTQENDALGQTITLNLLPTIEPKNGSSIYTGIDKQLQSIVEKKIKEGVEQFNAESGTVIIMDPKTGLIKALAIYPDYDPNNRIEKDPKIYGNIAVTSPYETGSTGKALTISAAIDLGVLSPEDIVMPEGHQGCEPIHNELLPLCTWDKKPQPPMSAKECFQKSDNICFYHISKMMDNVDFYNYLLNFGAGRPSGVDLASESFGLLKEGKYWNEGDVAAFSYGHGYQLNSIQAIDSFAAIANKGIRMRAYVVSKVVDSDGSIKEYKPIVLGRVISEKTSNTVKELMHYNFLTSISDFPHLGVYNIGIKTGTALIADSTGYTSEINSTMIGFDASEKATFVMLVRLEKPQGLKLSYYDVRPVWLSIFDSIKEIMGVPTK